MRAILGMDVDDHLFDLWRSWYCPDFQMFRAENLTGAAREALTLVDLSTLPMEIRDTFGADAGEWGTISEDAFRALPITVQEEILATHEPDEVHLFRWPSEPAAEKDAALIDYVLDGASPSQHKHVSDGTWQACAQFLPRAKYLGGTFPRGSGSNCFGTVMTAAGEDTEFDHTHPDQMEAFLASRASRSDDADLCAPGVVLLWRKSDDRPDHACVTLGDGWILNKQAQSWWAPRYVWDVQTTETQESGRGAFETWQLKRA